MWPHNKITKTRGKTIVNFPILTPFPRQFLRHKFPLGSTILKYTLNQSVCSIHYTWPVLSNPVSSIIHGACAAKTLWRQWRHLKHYRPKRPRTFWSAPRIATWNRSNGIPVLNHSRPQSLRSFWPAAGIESSGSNNFEITKEITKFCPYPVSQVCIYGARALDSCRRPEGR